MILRGKTETLSERVARRERECAEHAKPYLEWHPYFAWLPVPVGKDKYAWLVFLERRYDWASSTFKGTFYGAKYRIPNSNEFGEEQ